MFLFSVQLALWSHRLGKRELVFMLLVPFYVYLACVTFFSFSQPRRVAGGGGGVLRIVFWALLGLFIWAATWQNQQSDCDSEDSVRCPHEESLGH